MIDPMWQLQKKKKIMTNCNFKFKGNSNLRKIKRKKSNKFETSPRRLTVKFQMSFVEMNSILFYRTNNFYFYFDFLLWVRVSSSPTTSATFSLSKFVEFYFVREQTFSLRDSTEKRNCENDKKYQHILYRIGKTKKKKKIVLRSTSIRFIFLTKNNNNKMA